MNITQLANLSEAVTSAWYVRNGETVVGPVDTERLLKGVLSKRIPPDCMVTQSTWSAWRSIAQVREVAAVMKDATAPRPSETSGSKVTEQMVRQARDAGEA